MQENAKKNAWSVAAYFVRAGFSIQSEILPPVGNFRLPTSPGLFQPPSPPSQEV